MPDNTRRSLENGKNVADGRRPNAETEVADWRRERAC